MTGVGRLLVLFLQNIRRAHGDRGGDRVGSNVPQRKRQLLELEVAGFFLGVLGGAKRSHVVSVHPHSLLGHFV